MRLISDRGVVIGEDLTETQGAINIKKNVVFKPMGSYACFQNGIPNRLKTGKTSRKEMNFKHFLNED